MRLSIKAPRLHLEGVPDSSFKASPYKGEALKEILLALKEKDYTTLELSQELNKHKDTIQHHLQGGIKENFIKKDSISWPYKYSITPEGSEYLGRC